MSDINANIVVTQNEITISTTNDEIVITPNPLNMNIFTNDSAPGGFSGDLQYNANGVLGGIPTANYISGNLSLGNSNNLKITGGSNAYFLQTDGTGNLTWAPGTANVSGNGTSAGANNQIQISDGSGNFKSAPGFTFDTASNLLSTPGNILATGNANITGNTTSNNFIGTLANGNSNIKILANSDILISSNGNSNTMIINDSIINIEPEVVINQALTLKKDNIGSDLLFIESYNNSNIAVNGIETRRYRGNTGNPLTVQTGDEIYAIDHRAQYTNGSFNQSTLAGSNTVVTAVNANGNMSVNTIIYASYTNSNLILDYSNIVANGNVTANLFTGNANGLSNIPGANVTGIVANADYAANAGNANLANTVIVNAQPNITSVGNLSSLVVTGNANTGNLNTTQITASANITTPQFISNVSTGTSPLTVQSNTVVANLNADLLDGYDTDSANTANTIPVRDSNGNISANYFIGNGSQLTGIDTSLISNGSANVRTFANANVSISANGIANVVVVTGTDVLITGNANITANLDANNASFTQWANANNINVTSNLSANIVKTDNLYYANGVPYDFEQPGGSNTNIQFNDSDDFGGSNAFTFNQTTNAVSLTGNIIAGNFVPSGNQIIIQNASPNFTSNTTQGVIIGTNAYAIADATRISGIAIGFAAESVLDGIAIGSNTKSNGGVVIGQNTGDGGNGTIAIGSNINMQGAGLTDSIIIGSNAGIFNNGNTITSNVIILNSTGVAINYNPPGPNGAFYVTPIRSAQNDQILVYNTTTKEITHTSGITITSVPSSNITHLYPTLVYGNGAQAFYIDNLTGGNALPLSYAPQFAALIGSNLDFQFLYFGSQKIDLDIANSNAISFQANANANVFVIRGNEVEVNKPLQLHSANAATVANITGAVGYLMAVSDQNGQLGYYNTGNTRWEYVANNNPV